MGVRILVEYVDLKFFAALKQKGGEIVMTKRISGPGVAGHDHEFYQIFGARKSG